MGCSSQGDRNEADVHIRWLFNVKRQRMCQHHATKREPSVYTASMPPHLAPFLPLHNHPPKYQGLELFLTCGGLKRSSLLLMKQGMLEALFSRVPWCIGMMAGLRRDMLPQHLQSQSLQRGCSRKFWLVVPQQVSADDVAKTTFLLPTGKREDRGSS